MDDGRDYLARVKKYRESKNHTELKYCRICGRAFPYNGEGDIICPRCIQKEQDDFERVKKYLSENHSTEKETAEATGVPEATLTKWVREGRLSFGAGVSGLRCEMCGKPIRTGKLCADCQKKVSKKGYSTNRSNNDGKMRFAGRDN